jgi:hypothetical protein
MTNKLFVMTLFLMCLLSGAVVYGKGAWRLTPVNRPYQEPDSFYLEPEKTGVVNLKFAPAQAGRQVAWTLWNYSKKRIASGVVAVKPGATAQLKFKLPRGWYRLEFPALKYSSGIAVNTPPPAVRDKFFGIDAVLSWEIPGGNTDLRQKLVNSIKWMGVYGSRERINWRHVNPKPGKYNFSTTFKYDALAMMYRKAGIKMLVTFHNTPKYIIAGNSLYPKDLTVTARAWKSITEHFKEAWDSLEVWNEPDIRFGGYLPADQYAPMCKAISYAVSRSNPDLLIGGGVTAIPQADFVESLGDNGVFDIIDLYSFHNYLTPSGMVVDIKEYRKILARFKKSRMPLWITEAGVTFDLPQREMNEAEQRLTAMNIVAKSVEARAFGVARFYPFIYVYWKAYRSQKSTAMLYRDLSAGMASAAYAHVIRRLSGAKFIGSLRLPAAVTSRVFIRPGSNQATIVIFTEKPAMLASVNLPFKVEKVEGVDGRVIGGKTSKVLLSDGLAYCSVALDTIRPALSVNDQTLQRYTSSGAPGFDYTHSPVSPFIIYPMPMRKDLLPRTDSWRLKSLDRDLKVPTRVFNLSGKPFKTKLKFKMVSPEKTGRTFYSSTKLIHPGKYQPFILQIPKSELVLFPGASRIVIESDPVDGTGNSPLALPASLNIAIPLNMMTALKKYPHHVRLPIESPKQWNFDKAIIPGAKFKMSPRNNGKGVEFNVTFGNKQKMNEWFYPRLKIPAEIKLSDYDAVLIRARSMSRPKETLHHIGLHDPYAYKTRTSYLSSDGKFHASLIKFNRLAVPRWLPEQDPNDRLDLDAVKKISIGFGNYRFDREKLEISDIYLIKMRK